MRFAIGDIIVLVALAAWTVFMSGRLQKALARARQRRRVLDLVREWQTAEPARVREITRLLLQMEIPT